MTDEIKMTEKEYKKEIENLKKKIDTKTDEALELQKTVKKLSGEMAAVMPGMQKRICSENIFQRLLHSGKSRLEIIAVVHNHSGKDAAAEVERILPEDWKPEIHPKHAAQMKEIAETIEKAEKANVETLKDKLRKEILAEEAEKKAKKNKK